MTIVVTANSAPTGADKTVTANNTAATAQDTAYAFDADDFGFADDDAGDTLESVRIVTLPALGTLALDGTEVMADGVVTTARIDDGDLTFTPVAGASGDPYTTFTFKVNDGTDDSDDAYTMSITVNAAGTNTAPRGANKTVTVKAGTAYAFDADDFGFADDDAGDTLESVRIVTLPALGTLALDGTEVMLNQAVTRAEIDGDMLVFMLGAGVVGPGYASFTFKVNDGTDNSVSAYTMTIDVTGSPGEPTGLAATANGPSQIDLAWTRPGLHRLLRHHRLQDRGLLRRRLQLVRPRRRHRKHRHHLLRHRARSRHHAPLPRLRHQ